MEEALRLKQLGVPLKDIMQELAITVGLSNKDKKEVISLWYWKETYKKHLKAHSKQ